MMMIFGNNRPIGGTYKKPKPSKAEIKAFEDSFLSDWENQDFIALRGLIRILANYDDDNVESFLVPLIKKAIEEKELIIWDKEISYQLNGKVLLTNKFPYDAVVFKRDFIAWQKQTKSVAIPELLKDMLKLADVQDYNHQQLIAENEALKAKVAELEQSLSEYKELPTQTKNKVMPVIYGLCNLYFNKGKPLTKTRSDCGIIASELLTKFGINIGDKGLENYYNAGKNIIEDK